MTKFRTSSGDPTALAPEEIVEALLTRSGAAKKLPTSEDTLLDFLGLRQMSFDFAKDLDFVSEDASIGELRAALSLNDKLVAVQANLGDKRTRFSILHEIAHFVLPEHREKLFLDTDDTLGYWTKARLEREANGVAADLVFQGSRFTRETIDSQLSIKTVLDFAPKYGASYEAAVRRYVEKHVLPCAVVVYDRISRASDDVFEDDPYKLQYTITSMPFRTKYFSGIDATPNRFSRAELYSPKLYSDVMRGELVVDGRGKDRKKFDTEVFSNGYKIFQLILGPSEDR